MQPPEQPPSYPYQPPPPSTGTNGMAIAAMVVSLASLVTCPLVGAVGIYLGRRAKDEISRSGEQGEGMAQAGIVVGWVSIGLLVLSLCVIGLFFGIGAGTGGFSY